MVFFHVIEVLQVLSVVVALFVVELDCVVYIPNLDFHSVCCLSRKFIVYCKETDFQYRVGKGHCINLWHMIMGNIV